MKSGFLEGLGEVYGGVFFNDVGVGLFVFGIFLCFYRSVGFGIYILNLRQIKGEGGMVEWLGWGGRGCLYYCYFRGYYSWLD